MCLKIWSDKHYKLLFVIAVVHGLVVNEPKNTAVVVGSNVEFSCSSNTTYLPIDFTSSICWKYSLFGSDQVVTIFDRKRLNETFAREHSATVVNSNVTHSVLRLSSVQPQSSGLYHCNDISQETSLIAAELLVICTVV